MAHLVTAGKDRDRLISIADAADRLGVKPWDVVNLIESGAVQSVTLVDSSTLPKHQESSA